MVGGGWETDQGSSHAHAMVEASYMEGTSWKVEFHQFSSSSSVKVVAYALCMSYAI